MRKCALNVMDNNLNNLSSSSYQFLLIMCHSKSNVHLFRKRNPGKVTNNIHCI